jgi:ornithine carbamoyltransferase
MSCSIPHRHLWSAERLSAADLRALLDAATEVKRAKQRDSGWAPLRGRNLALLADSSDGAALIFDRAVRQLGGTVTLLDARAWQTSVGAHMADAARMLGRLYDAVDCCGLPAALLDQLDAHCGVPVFNGLARAEHPLSGVGALLTMRELSGQPLERLHLQLSGDPDSPRYRAAAALARLGDVEVLPQETVAVGAADAAGGEPDFIFDALAVPGATDRLIMPDASADARARVAALLGENSQCALQALLVCSLH